MLAVAAVDEQTAAEAIEKIKIRWDVLPFNVDPLETLRPGAKTARVEGNVWVRPTPTPGQPPPLPEIKRSEMDGRAVCRSGRRAHADGGGDGSALVLR